MKNKEELKYLLERYINQKITEDEYQRLFEALEDKNNTTGWKKVIRQMMERQPADPDYKSSRWEPVITKILEKDRKANRKNNRRRQLFTIRRIAAAVAVILLLSAGIWFTIQYKYKEHVVTTTALKEENNNILPGSNKAILTLGNGEKIVLDSTNNGLLSMQGKTKIIKVNNGLLTYNRQLITDNRQQEIQYNTITTPRGGQYEVVLPDGSKVWLNATSSIKFPAAFTRNKRVVEITGEAYFEIAKNADRPFIVKKGDVEIQVLGTQFNVNAYDDEPGMKVTMLEGLVRIVQQTTDNRQLIKPGEQIRLNKNGKMKLIENADVSEAVAWKEGLFQFSDDNIEQIMRQISRWYNVEIIYENGIPEGHITGKIPRNTNLSNVLKIMQLSGVHFKIEGRKVIVLATEKI